MREKQETLMFQMLEKRGIVGEDAVLFVEEWFTNTSEFDNVIEFHQTFDHPINDDVDFIPKPEEVQLRLNLIGEELVELAQATNDDMLMVNTIVMMLNLLTKESDYVSRVALTIKQWHNEIMEASWSNKPSRKAKTNKQAMVEAIDALGDLGYVWKGAVLMYGLKDKYHLVEDEIHRSNMSKACHNGHGVVQTIAKADKEKVTLIRKQKGINTIFYKQGGKVYKNALYQPANLDKYVPEIDD